MSRGTRSLSGSLGTDGVSVVRENSWLTSLYEPLAFSCGSSAASACGFDSRLASRFASASRISGSFCSARS